jgi:RNA polymerase sigma-70 factor (ECF subfamily)
MATQPSASKLELPAGVVAGLWRRAEAKRWALAEPDFGAALERSAVQRFREHAPSGRELGQYLDSLHLDDLALACACARGSEPAWEHFVREFRPILLRIAGRGQQTDRARDVADSIYAELYGLEERHGVRRSLFDYFHGRSTLAGWLKAVVAQRLVDKARASRRFDPLPDDEASMPDPSSGTTPESDLDRRRFLALVRQALEEAIAGLEARDRLRLTLYYAQDIKLAAVGRVLGESEATSSRKLERTRVGLRAAVERRLREVDRLTDAQIALCFDHARTDPAFDLARTLRLPEGPDGGTVVSSSPRGSYPGGS